MTLRPTDGEHIARIGYEAQDMENHHPIKIAYAPDLPKSRRLCKNSKLT